jgi:hypothetical protein
VDEENDGFAVLPYTKLGIGKVDVEAVTLARAVTYICPYPRAVLPPVEVWCFVFMGDITARDARCGI